MGEVAKMRLFSNIHIINKMKKVDIVNFGSIHSITGPVANLRRILNHKQYFEDRGYDVTVIANDSFIIGPMTAVPPSGSEATKKLSLRMKLSSKLRMSSRNSRWLSEIVYDRRTQGVKRLIDYYVSLNRTPDIIEFQEWPACYYYLKNRKEHHAKVVMFYHTEGIPFEMELQYYPKLRGSKFISEEQKRFDWTIAHIDKLVFIARAAQKNFLQCYPNYDVKDTTVILNGIDDFSDVEKAFIEKNRDENLTPQYRFCCTGTINHRKGQNIIVEALQKLPKDMLNKIHVDLIGEGPERPVLEEIVNKSGLQNVVNFVGSLPNKEVFKYLAKNNIYILMSRSEGLPISIIEALRASLAIISTNIAGIPELVEEGYNGFLLNPSSEELVGLLLKLPEYGWNKIGDNSRTKFEKEFTFERMKTEYCNMYDSLYENNGK